MINLTEGEIHRAFELTRQIPELHPPYSWTKWQRRLAGKKVIALVAESDGKTIGCKVGYHEEKWFYSWVGGVLPAWRGKGVARMLADRMEALAAAQGASRIRMKTQNRFRAMLIFAIGNGFQVVDIERKSVNATPVDLKIVLEKKI